jgi:hypothetical protein
MIPIDFEVTGSKVKVTGALTSKSLSTQWIGTKILQVNNGFVPKSFTSTNN